MIVVVVVVMVVAVVVMVVVVVVLVVVVAAVRLGQAQTMEINDWLPISDTSPATRLHCAPPHVLCCCDVAKETPHDTNAS